MSNYTTKRVGPWGLTPAEADTIRLVAQAAEIERLKADAERYRWLKTRPIEVPTNGPDLALWSDSCGDALRGDDADAAIDAAMAAAPDLLAEVIRLRAEVAALKGGAA